LAVPRPLPADSPDSTISEGRIMQHVEALAHIPGGRGVAGPAPLRCELCAACRPHALCTPRAQRVSVEPTPQGSTPCCAQTRQGALRLHSVARACQVGTPGYAEAVRYLLREAGKVKDLAANRSDLAVEARAPQRRSARRAACSSVTGRPPLLRPRAEPRSAAHALAHTRLAPRRSSGRSSGRRAAGFAGATGPEGRVIPYPTIPYPAGGAGDRVGRDGHALPQR